MLINCYDLDCILNKISIKNYNFGEIYLCGVLYAFGSALFAGITSILAKCGIKKTDSHVATDYVQLLF